MRSRLAVGLVSHQLANPRPTGVDRYARELAGALAARSDVSLVLCAPQEPADAPDVRPGWVPAGVPVRRVPGPRRAVIAGWSTVGWPSVDRACGEVDLVHVTLSMFPCPTRRPFVYTVHDLFPVQHPEWYPRRDRFTVSRAFRSLERAAGLIAVSSWTARALAELPWIDPAIVTVVPEGVTPRFAVVPDDAAVAEACAALDVDPGGFDVFVGQVSTRKDVAVVVEALATARSPRPLVLAGPPGDASAAVAETARRCGVSALLRWAGFVPDDRLHLLLHGARALLHPCPAEGFGLTPLEAMAAGTPTVVADAGALPETVGEAALRCPPRDVEAWAAALDRLEDPVVLADLAERGRAWVRRYDWHAVATQTVRVYEDALRRRP